MRRPPFFSSEGSLPAAFSSLQGWERKGAFHPFWSRWDQNRGQWDWNWEEWGTWQQRIGWSHLFVGAHPSAPDVANFTNYLLAAMSYECKVKDLPPYCLHTNCCTCTKIFTLLKTDLSQMCHLTFLQIKNYHSFANISLPYSNQPYTNISLPKSDLKKYRVFF